MNSSSAPQVNPQVQKAVEAASKAYNTGAAHVKRVAGPVGEKLGGALGGRSLDKGLLRIRLARLFESRSQTRIRSSSDCVCS
jgi:hypothetical protein